MPMIWDESGFVIAEVGEATVIGVDLAGGDEAVELDVLTWKPHDSVADIAHTLFGPFMIERLNENVFRLWLPDHEGQSRIAAGPFPSRAEAEGAAAAIYLAKVETDRHRHHCATEGCTKPADIWLEKGGVGSPYCDDCSRSIEALSRSGSGVVDAIERAQQMLERASVTVKPLEWWSRSDFDGHTLKTYYAAQSPFGELRATSPEQGQADYERHILEALQSASVTDNAVHINSEDRPESFVRKCLILPRDEGEALFVETSVGVFAYLDGYAVIPIEKYHSMNGATGFAPENSWPCNACGALRPTAEGHDPCIANLPGVAHACCGHGSGHAYTVFNDGRVLSGHFDHVHVKLNDKMVSEDTPDQLDVVKGEITPSMLPIKLSRLGFLLLAVLSSQKR